MPSLTTTIQAHGPVVQLAVLVSEPRRRALQQRRATVPAPVVINGLIDTGASCTAVDPTVISQLGITPTGSVQIMTPSTGSAPHACNQFDVALAFVLGSGRDFKIIDTLPVIESALSHQGHEALIGRDVLSQGLLFYNGVEDSLTLSF